MNNALIARHWERSLSTKSDLNTVFVQPLRNETPLNFCKVSFLTNSFRADAGYSSLLCVSYSASYSCFIHCCCNHFIRLARPERCALGTERLSSAFSESDCNLAFLLVMLLGSVAGYWFCKLRINLLRSA